jgi:hypothetical protein
MVSSDSNKQRCKLNSISKMKIDNGETQRDKELLYDKYVEKVVAMKNLSRFGDVFPDRVHKILPEELNKYNNLYFTPDPIDDTNLQIELENQFRNKEIEDKKEQLKISKELQKVKEIQEIADSGLGLSLGEDINPFSDEGKAYLQSEAVKYPSGFRGLVEDSRKAEEEVKQGLVMAEIERIAEDTFNKFINIDPTYDNSLFTKLVHQEIRNKVNDVFKNNPKFKADKMEKVAKNIEKQVLKARGLLVGKERKRRSDFGKRRKVDDVDAGAGAFAGADAGFGAGADTKITNLKDRSNSLSVNETKKRVVPNAPIKAKAKAEPKNLVGIPEGKFDVF